jgi:hypothetical protein
MTNNLSLLKVAVDSKEEVSTFIVTIVRDLMVSMKERSAKRKRQNPSPRAGP